MSKYQISLGASAGRAPQGTTVRLSKAVIRNPKCVYHVLAQIVYYVTLDTMVAPTHKNPKKRIKKLGVMLREHHTKHKFNYLIAFSIVIVESSGAVSPI